MGQSKQPAQGEGAGEDGPGRRQGAPELLEPAQLEGGAWLERVSNSGWDLKCLVCPAVDWSRAGEGQRSLQEGRSMASASEPRGFQACRRLPVWGLEEACAEESRGRGPESEWDVPSEGPLGSLLTWSSSFPWFHPLLRLQGLRSEKASSCARVTRPPFTSGDAGGEEGQGALRSWISQTSGFTLNKGS